MTHIKKPACSSLGHRWLLLFCSLLSQGCADKPVGDVQLSGNAATSNDVDVTLLKMEGPTMGSYFSITIANPPEELDSDWQLAIEQELRKINDLMSTYLESSELSRFNQSPSTEWFPVSPELAFVVDAAQTISRESSGALDVTVSPLVNLWNFGPKKRRREPPSAEEIEAAKAIIGYDKLEVRLDPPALRKLIPELQVDLSAIAPGYATDRLVEILAGFGCDNVFVDISGEVRARGMRGERNWRVAIEDPSDDARSYHLAYELRDRAIATSGDYRNFFEHNGKRYSHTIDPRTGRPVDHGVASVSVFAERSMDADAWATAFTVLGMEAGMELAEKLGMQVLIVRRAADGSFEERQSPLFPESLPLSEKSSQ
jgi:thiamine biosynthesis lipoprotein